jgi:hypothetical protein
MKAVSILTFLYDRHLNSFLGCKKIDLIHKWGKPLKTYVNGNRKYLIYYSSKVVIEANENSHNTSSPVNSSGTISKKCVTIFELIRNTVVSYRSEEKLCPPNEWSQQALAPYHK